MAIIRCPECGHEISDKAPFCPSCGVAIAGRVIKCPECGKVYFSDLSECPNCHHLTSVSRPVHTELAKEASNRQDAETEVALAETASEKDAASMSHSRLEDSVVNPQSAQTRQSSFSEGVQPAMQFPDESNAPKAHAKRNNKTILIVSVVIVVIIAGLCWWMAKSSEDDKELAAYEYAMTSKDPQVLQGYLDNYADAPEAHRDSIEAHLEMLKQVDQDWTNAVVSGSKSALQQYIEMHPDSPFKAIALHKIDSIDWASACGLNTVEAIEEYIETHPDGDHVDDANNKIKALNAKTLQPEEKVMINSLFSSFFSSINNKDEDALTSTVNPVLSSFLGKSDATRSDVVTFMHKLYKSDVASMTWQPLRDYSINKKEIGDQQYEYSVSFSATQDVQHTDNTSSVAKYRINAKVNPDGRITELNMTKVLE